MTLGEAAAATATEAGAAGLAPSAELAVAMPTATGGAGLGAGAAGLSPAAESAVTIPTAAPTTASGGSSILDSMKTASKTLNTMKAMGRLATGQDKNVSSSFSDMTTMVVGGDALKKLNLFQGTELSTKPDSSLGTIQPNPDGPGKIVVKDQMSPTSTSLMNPNSPLANQSSEFGPNNGMAIPSQTNTAAPTPTKTSTSDVFSPEVSASPFFKSISPSVLDDLQKNHPDVIQNVNDLWKSLGLSN
jgi:hypothetical protein